jgi:hypothetical protein
LPDFIGTVYPDGGKYSKLPTTKMYQMAVNIKNGNKIKISTFFHFKALPNLPELALLV